MNDLSPSSISRLLDSLSLVMLLVRRLAVSGVSPSSALGVGKLPTSAVVVTVEDMISC